VSRGGEAQPPGNDPLGGIFPQLCSHVFSGAQDSSGSWSERGVAIYGL